MSRASSTTRCSGSDWSGSISCSSTGGTMPSPRLPRGGRAGSTSCSAPARSTASARTNFDTPHAGAWSTAGMPLRRMQVQYSLLDSRAGERAWPRPRPSTASHLLCYGTVAGGFLGDRWLGAPEPARPLREPLADQIQADHRRFRRLGSVPGAAADAAPDRRPPRHRHRHGREPLRCSTGRRSPPSSSAPATARISRRISRSADLALEPTRTTPRSPPCWRSASGLAGDVYRRSSATAPAATARS